MSKYNFTLISSKAPELTDELADVLFTVGCDDATPGICDGVFRISFHREEESLEAAINSAIQNVKTAGLSVDHVEIEVEAMAQTA